jgi:glucokinase
VFEGGAGGAGEIGHLSIDHNGPLCNCGSYGCIEAYVGQRYFSERTRDMLQEYPKSLIIELVSGDLSKIEPKIVSQAALKGDEAAIKVFTEAGRLLGCALASAMNVIDVPVAVIGGGISAAPEFVYDAIRTSLRERILKSQQNVRVVRAQLGNAAGIIGAASLVM